MEDQRTDAAPWVRLQDLLMQHEDVQDFLHALAVLTSSSLSTRGTVYCGITLQRSRNHQFTVASSDGEALQLDEIQYAFGDGPCLDAIRVQDEVHVGNAATDSRWPEYMEHIRDVGIRSLYSVPLKLGGEAKAAMNLYAKDPDVFDEDFRRVARTYAAEASHALLLAVRVSQHVATVEDLQAVLASRTDIDLAVGIIMGQDRCTQREAFDTLRRASNSRNIKVRVLAAEIVGRLNGEPGTTHFAAGR
ncbi:GAF and ANTAR domain-containing protein [Arthrobacter sp. zg-Y820]|uniref:GAF and ANTAR domain-containing protein n=1 Tax=unclassified Arthrobacter TaxID=235627 RepID=UPI001E36FDBD|nr:MULTISPECIES: GAF and ANTAR domain-containing protein [unclassified Arthrobacter]MCC9197230.1 GAF and ANTAR domain-containing protein [Arthrobacter sp. zg-Y820]MDK1280095.1 GAF and ANTAR domain-containing protein [Arthrobacter sp. zg.Y820]MDK1360767.1 GAF and ANTAR domain-containing protein [Arthrobacter sp. zg-Y1219]WIB09388.1 GAF and ANTAR domain-containing protein [Arthrobacter sp. zg-Y820]